MQIHITLNSGASVSLTREQQVKLEEFVNKLVLGKQPANGETNNVRKKTYRIMGARKWTQEEENEIMDYPKIRPETARMLARKFGRTPISVQQRHWKLRTGRGLHRSTVNHTVADNVTSN